MKIASIQMAMNWSLAENVQSIVNSIADAAKQEVRLVVFPELSVTGFHRRILECCADASSSETWLHQIQMACRSNEIAAYIGMPRFQDDSMFNSYVLINSDGDLAAETRKNGLTETESYIFEAGISRPVSVIYGTKTLIVLCREIVDLSLIASQLDESIDLIIWPGYISHEKTLPIGDEPVTQAQAAIVAKALGATLVQSNWANSLNDPDLTTTGGSIAISSSGNPFFRAPDLHSGRCILDLQADTGVWQG